MPSQATPSISSQTHQGVPVSPGIQIAPYHIYDPGLPVVSSRAIAPAEVEREKERLREAVARTRREILELRNKIQENLDEAHASIFDPQLMILEDPELAEQTVERIGRYHECAETAFMGMLQKFAGQFSAVADPYIASRKSDILDVGHRLVRNLLPVDSGRYGLTFPIDTIVLAPDLSP